jgi:NAD(P)-dependent dehydrogenase (short-subunit alcohol dehydrogenase family)
MTVVVITGSNSGFGREAALEFARNGDTVVATMRNTDKAESLREAARKEDLNISVLGLDVTDPESFAQFGAKVVAKFGSVDVLINNAGILRPGALEDLDEAKLRLVMETNFFGPMLLTRGSRAAVISLWSVRCRESPDCRGTWRIRPASSRSKALLKRCDMKSIDGVFICP